MTTSFSGGRSQSTRKELPTMGKQLVNLQFKFGHIWFKIKQFWPFDEISIFNNGGHLGWRAWLSDIT
jgi:hypothetical protein